MTFALLAGPPSWPINTSWSSPHASRGISWIVTGGFQQLGTQLRITARIVGVATGIAVESVKVDGEMADLFNLQDQIVEGLTLGFAEIAGVVPPAVSTAAPGPEDSSPSAEDIAVVQSGSSEQVRDTTPADITGGIVIGDASPQLGLAVGSRVGAVPEDWPVSYPRHLKRSERISRTPLSCRLRVRGYETYRAEATAGRYGRTR